MPRFIAKPIVVEAHQYVSGGSFPPSFAMAVMRHRPDGTIEVATGDGARTCKNLDWIMRGPSGDFSVVRAAAFEAMFEEQRAEPRRTRKEMINV